MAPKYPHRAQNWAVNVSSATGEERIMAGAIQLLCQLEKDPKDPKKPYVAYIVGLKRLTLLARFENVDSGLKAAKIQALALLQQGK